MKIISGGVCAAKGFTASGVHCGIRKNKTKRDLALIYSEKKATAAAVYTTNKVKGAPLTVTKNNIADGFAQAVICNSGNANTCNANGIEIAETTCKCIPGLSEGERTSTTTCTVSFSPAIPNSTPQAEVARATTSSFKPGIRACGIAKPGAMTVGNNASRSNTI